MEFINTYRSTRSGFSHTTELHNEGRLLSTAKCYYINRTWEAYTYQSCMQKAVYIAMENEIQTQKELMGIKRLTKEKKQEIINYSSLINQLKNLKL